MNFYIVIPAHNEEAFISKTLQSLTEQTLLPKQIVVVNDHSTDNTQQIIDSFSKQFSFIDSIEIRSEEKHAPGSKIIHAFYKGLETLDTNYDVLCKFDSDLIFPSNYLEQLSKTFRENPRCGMAGGFCYIDKNGNWELENLTNKDHIRGALKAYRKECFEQIGGLKKAMGWDTVDELLAQYYQWSVNTLENLHVKHLKPTGLNYKKQAGLKQGEAFYRLRYGKTLTRIAALKLALKKKKWAYYFECMKGFAKSKKNKIPFLVNETEGSFIRALRWRGIKKKLF